MSEITRILRQIEDGDNSQAELLLPLVYTELKNLASARLSRERGEHLLQTTALVHEAYARLVDVEQVQRWHSRAHFFGAIAEAMRRILVDEARKRQSRKRGGDFRRVSGISHLSYKSNSSNEERILAVSEALESYETVSSRACQVVKLRFFASMTNDEIPQTLNISVPTVKRDWATAKVWIFRHLNPDTSE